MNPFFSDEEKQYLLQIARNKIEGCFFPEKIHEIRSGFERLDKILAGAFVSVYIAGELRGCIGSFSEDEPVIKVIRKMAVQAVSHDYRFEPVSVRELEQLGIEISVLTPRKKISSLNELVTGRDGIYIIKGFNRGTLLPQVAAENGWDAETFVSYCSMYKAGIGRDGWRQAELYTYEAIVFRDFIKK